MNFVYPPHYIMSSNDQCKRKIVSSDSSYQTLKKKNRIVNDEYRSLFLSAFNTIVVLEISDFHKENCVLMRNELHLFFHVSFPSMRNSHSCCSW